MAKRITMKSGRVTRTFVVEASPFPKPGDLCTIKGQGAEWIITSVRDTKVLATFTTQHGRLRLLK